MADSPDAQISHEAAISYWSGVPATVDGMLGGYPSVSRLDLRSSRTSLAKLRRLYPPSRKSATPWGRALDCGAGVGRITTGLLMHVCETVDLIEPIEKFAAEARTLRESADPGIASRVGDVVVAGLQDWAPPTGRTYDLIWNQWCLGHLTDAQLVAWLRRCTAALSEGGWIVVKENLSTNTDESDAFDKLDSSVTRTDKTFRRIFVESGLELKRTELQKGFPKDLLPVRTYGLRPKNAGDSKAV